MGEDASKYLALMIILVEEAFGRSDGVDAVVEETAVEELEEDAEAGVEEAGIEAAGA